MAALVAMGVAGSVAFELTGGATAAYGEIYVQYQYPFPLSAITQNFNSNHGATDFSYGGCAGDPIPSIADGVVTNKLSGNGMGHRVEIRHADGMYSGYCHMAAASTLALGASVSRGESVGFIGNSGVSAYHLHLALSSTSSATLSGQNGYASCINAIPYIAARLNPPTPEPEETSMWIFKQENGPYSNTYWVVNPNATANTALPFNGRAVQILQANAAAFDNTSAHKMNVSGERFALIMEAINVFP